MKQELVYEAIERLSEGEQPTQEQQLWDELCERGRLARENMDQGRWDIGDDALLVEKDYGENSIAAYAREILVAVKRVEEYRTVCGFYEKSARAEFLESTPNITYTHYRTGMRMKDISRAYWFLAKAALRNWTTDHADAVMTRYLGRKRKKADEHVLLDVPIKTLRHWSPRDAELTLVVSEVNTVQAFVEYYRKRGKKPALRLVLQEVEE